MRVQSGAARLALAAVIAFSVASCGPKPKEKPAPKPNLTVSTELVRLTSLPHAVEASGTVAAWQEVPVGSETGGLEVAAVLVDEGSYVRQGQVLVKLDDRLLRAELARQNASVASANAQLAQAEAALARAQELKQKGFLAQATLDARLAEQRTAAAGVQQAQAARSETLTRLEQTNVRAPVPGKITARSVVKGQIVSTGAELFRLVRGGQVELNAQVPEDELRLIRPGMAATVTGGQGGTTTGVVRLITAQVDPQTRLGLARITLPGGSGFQPGMFARASIDVGAVPALAVPQAALVWRDGKAGVFVIDAKSRAHYRAIQTGERSGDYVEVLSGVRAGERIAVNGAGFLGENDLVKIGAAPR
jgi:RND family efflux transporter MFP subunit